jgi:uncharacterized repeat protein (TIGR01451 family)
MRRKQLGITATAAVLVLATTACEPAPTPWEVELVSVNAAGTAPGNGSSGSVVWSADGSVVGFSSTSNDLTAAGDWNDAAEDAHVRDLETGVTTLESPHPPVDRSCCTKVDALSADGTKVLFHTSLDGLTSLPDPGGRYDYFLRDRVSGTTTVVSVNASGQGTGNDSSGETWHEALMTPDGTKVAFESGASNLVWPSVEFIGSGIYVRDLATDTTTHVAGNVERLEGFSADGTRVLFSTKASLLPEDGNGVNDLYLHDLTAGTTTLVSANADGTAGGARTSDGSLTSDGDRVVFTSSSSDVVPGGVDTNGRDDVFLRDLAAGTTRVVSTDASGMASTGGTDGLFNPDESMVVYTSNGSVSDPDQTDLYVKDLATESLTLVTPRTADNAGGTEQLAPVGFTGDGRVLVFTSEAGNFGPVDENGVTDVYAHDLVSGTTHVVSVGPDGIRAGGSNSGWVGDPVAAVSPTGRRVLYLRSGEVFMATLQLADLAVTGSVESSGEALTYELTASNSGPDGVEGVELALLLPEGTSFSSADTTAGTCEEVQPRVVACALGDLEAGVVADVAVSATVQAPPGSPLDAVALVRSATYDADADDNVVTLTSTVG